DGVSLEFAVGLVGRTAAIALVNYSPSLPTWKEIVKNPEVLKTIPQGDVIVALENAIDEKDFKVDGVEKVITFLEEFSKEILVAWCKIIATKKPKIINSLREEILQRVLGYAGYKFSTEVIKKLKEI
ncbi:MAG: hypothetical protein QXF15_03525, partial [Candidatus Aenigmatarchaeota archaeon]